MAYNWGKAAKDRRPDMARAANPVCYDIFWKTRHAKEKRIMDGMMQQNILIAQQQQQQQQQQHPEDLARLPALVPKPARAGCFSCFALAICGSKPSF
jgi:acyl carrier protein phosphodiesterase